MVVADWEPGVGARDRVAPASTSTSGRYAERALPRPASAARASSHAVRVSGLFDSAVSMTSASVMGPSCGCLGAPASGARPEAGAPTRAGGVHGLSGAEEGPGSTWWGARGVRGGGAGPQE